MEQAISRIVTELEEVRVFADPFNPRSQFQSQSHLISDSSLFDLQTLLNNTFDTNDSTSMGRLYDELSSKNLSPSNIVGPIASAMDSNTTRLSLLASNVYLSLLSSPNSPVFTLFTPMAFLSLLQSIRRSLKRRPQGQTGASGLSQGSQPPPNRKKKSGGRGRGSKNCARSFNNVECEVEESEFDARSLFPVLERLELVMGLIHLDRFPDSLKSLVQTMTEIPVMALEVCGSSGNYSKLVDSCSRIMIEVLKPEHGDPANTAVEVLKSLSPMILQHKSQARTFAMGFVTNRMMRVANGCNSAKKAIVNFPKYLAQKAPVKSEHRALAVESINEVVRALGLEDQIGFVEYVLKMTKGKANLRLLAVDLILMLVMSLRDPLGMNSEKDVKDSWGVKCLMALVERCLDVVAGIRARALSSLSQLMGFLCGNERNESVLQEVMGIGNAGEGRMSDLLMKRCADEKAAVRRAALVLVAKLTAIFGSCLGGALLKTMGMACSDPLVSIRKAAISAISEAFRKFPEKSVTTEWLHSVPRLIADNEVSIQEECENLFLELVLDRISKAGSSLLPRMGSSLNNLNGKQKNLDMDVDSILPDDVLSLLEELCNGEVMPWVKKICKNLGKKNRIKNQIATALQNIITTSESLWLTRSMPIEKWTAPPGSWLLLSEVSAFLPKAVDWEFLHHHWQLLDKDGMEIETHKPVIQDRCQEEDIESNSVAWAGDRVFLLQTISNVSVELPSEAAADLAHNLLKRVDEFNMHSTEVNAHVKALNTLCKRKASSPEEADVLVKKWVKQVLSKASQILEKYISENSEANKNCSVFTPPRSGKTKATIKSLSKAVTAVYTIGSVVIICPSPDTSTIVPLLHTIVTSGNSDKKMKFPVPTISIMQTAPSLYIQAWLTLGKICLADGKLAKRYIPLFVQEIEKSESAALRNNLVVMMADFCVRYTALVDCYITKITKCLCDPCELVRRQTFILLSRLLQRDYVKWRGVMFLRFLLSLVDESKKIRQLADFLFGNILKVKAPLLAYNSFIEAIYVLNDCHAHKGHSDYQSSQSESRFFSIRGNDEESRSKRMHIYVSLLKQMAPEHLLATFAKLCAEILAAASDGALNIDDVTGKSVLQDAFQILSCKEIRLPSNRGLLSESADMDEEVGDGGGASTSATAAAAAARGKITQAVKKSLIQNMIPIFIELKRLLENKNSPLIGSLMECLRIILKDYKNEIDEILIADKQLQKELLYDMQKFEAAKAKSTVAEAVAKNRKASSFNSPNVPKATADENKSTTNEFQDNAKLASAIANATAEATARSVLKEVNTGKMTPPLSALKVPKLKSFHGEGTSQIDKRLDVLESVRKRQTFDSDGEN